MQLTPLFILLLGSVLQIIYLLVGGWGVWKNTPGPQRSLFIKRWSENISLDILNKISLPVLIIPLGFLIGERRNLIASPDEFKINIFHFFFAIFFMDFIFYWRHRIYHSWMQKWHRLHHNDNGYDISLTLRFHPIENLINYLIIFSGILFLRIPAWEAVFIIQLFAFQALWSHVADFHNDVTTVNLWDRVFVTPRIHRLHHDIGQTGRNYGFLFSFWDQIFGTFITSKKITSKENL